MRSRVGEAGAVLLLLLLTIGFYWKLAFSDQYTWFNHWDLCGLEIPRLQFQAREIHAGRFPLWDPHIWAGQPLVGQTQPGPLYPLNLLFCLLPLRGGYLRTNLLNWYYILIHFQAALFCYWLCRDLERSRLASILAGAVLSFGGFVGSVPWLDVLNGAVWTPLVLLFLLRVLRGHKPLPSTGLFGVSLGIAWLSGHHEIPLLTSLLALAVGAYAVFRRSLETLRAAARLACLLTLGVAIAGMVASVQLLPTYEFGKVSKRWVETGEPLGWNERIPYAIHARYSLPPRGLLGFVVPKPSPEGAQTAFLGVVALALAALGVLAARRIPGVRLLSAIGAIALLYALGPLTPLHRILYAVVPMLDKARSPVRALYLCNLAMAVLAAYGLDRLLALRASSARRTALLICLFALSLAELTAVGKQRIQNLRDAKPNLVDALSQDEDVAEYLRSRPELARLVLNKDDVVIDFGDWHGIDMLQGAGAGITSNIYEHALHTTRTQGLFAVTHYAGRSPVAPDWEPMFRGHSGLQVFRNPRPLPRARMVHEAVSVSSPAVLRLLIQDPSFDPARTAIIGPVPSLERCDTPDQVDLLRHEPDRIAIRARTGCRGLLIVADTFFPGWKADVDGRAAPIQEVYGAMRGVVLAPGDHVIEMRYRPSSVYAGAALALAGLLLAAFLQFR